MSSMLIISVRQNFWDASSPSLQTMWGDVAKTTLSTKVFSLQETQSTLAKLKGQRILLLIHGYNDTEAPTVSNYFVIADNIRTWVVDASGKCLYDHIIGFVWPGDGHFYDYYLAEKNAAICASRLRELLVQLSSVCASLDVFAHSMGNRLLLEALNFLPTTETVSPIIQTYFSVAAAVDDNSIDLKQAFYQSTRHIQDIEILYSTKDPVERWAYPLITFKQALGHEGDKTPKALPLNAQTLDCSALVFNHSGYFTQAPIYQWMKKRKTGEIAGPGVVEDMVLSASGAVAVTRYRQENLANNP